MDNVDLAASRGQYLTEVKKALARKGYIAGSILEQIEMVPTVQSPTAYNSQKTKDGWAEPPQEIKDAVDNAMD